MAPKFLLATDLHLTHRPEDEYRWGLFDWIIEKYGGSSVEHIIFLGDLTEKKNNHPEELVNRLIESVERLSDTFDGVTFLKGNHGYDADAFRPYFRFLKLLKNVHYFIDPESIAN